MFKKEENSSKWQGKIQDQNYPLTIADMDLPLFAPFKDTLMKKINDINNLTYKNRSQQYFQAIIGWYHKHHLDNIDEVSSNERFELNKDYFIECPSICNLIGCSILAFTKQKENVLIFTPVYSFYINAVKVLNREIVCCQLQQQTLIENEKRYRYEFDFDDFERKMDQYRPRLIILCNPHNPSGKVFTRQELNFIVKKAEQHNTYIISDEIMCDFTLYPCKGVESNTSQTNISPPNKFISLINYPYQRILVGNSISKVFNCESVQGGYGIIRSKQTRNIYNFINYKAIKLLTNQMSIILTPVIYTKHGEEWIRKVNKIICENYQLLTQTFKTQSCLKIFQLQSSYLTTIQFDFSSINCQHQPSNQFLVNSLKKYGIYFTPMQEYFYPPTLRNVFRIAIAMQHDQFKKFIVKFQQCIHFIKDSLLVQNNSSRLQMIKKSKL